MGPKFFTLGESSAPAGVSLANSYVASADFPATPAAPDLDPGEISHRRRTGRPSLGSLLVRAGHVTEEQVRAALAEGIRTGERLGEVLVRERLVTDEVIAEFLATQWRVPFVKTAALAVDPSAIRQIPLRVARELDAVPIGFGGDGVLLAIAEPGEEMFRKLGERIPDASYVVIARSALDSLLESRLYTDEPTERRKGSDPQLLAVGEAPFQPPGSSPPNDVEPNVENSRNPAAAALLPDPPPAEKSDSPAVEDGIEAPPAYTEPDPAFVESGEEPATRAADQSGDDPIADLLGTTAPSPLSDPSEELPTGIDAALAAITAASTALEQVRSEVFVLARALESTRAELTGRDSLLAERGARLQATQQDLLQEREGVRRLQAELVDQSALVVAARKQLAGLSETLDAIAPNGAEGQEQAGRDGSSSD